MQLDYLTSDHDDANCDSVAPNPEFDPYEPPNPNYLGPPETGQPDLYIDRSGALFTLLSLERVGTENGQIFHARSSKGGFFEGVVPTAELQTDNPVWSKSFPLSGPLWTDIEWFTLANMGHTFHMHQGWDNIRYSFNTVHAPGTALLVASGLGFLAIARRWRQRT